MKFLFITLTILLFTLSSYSQTILFSEDFQGETNGDVTGVSAEGIPWSASCPLCASGDLFEVDDTFGTMKGLRGNDTNGAADFVANGIDATGMHIIIFEFDYESSGYSGSGNLECASECSGCSGDPADVLIGGCNTCWDYLTWNLSTGTFNDGGMVLGDNCSVSDNGHVISNPGCSSPYDANGNLIPGNDPSNLTITIQMAMWAGNENMVIDNLIITGYTRTEAINAGLMANAGDDNTISLCGPAGTVNLFDELLGNPSIGGTWSGPSTTSGGYLGTINLNTANTGTYTYEVTTGSGCIDASTITIQSGGTGPNVSVTGNLSICNGNNTTITASGADTYQWSDLSTGTTFTTSTAGNYYVVGTNACGTDTAFFTINTNGSAPIGVLTGDLFTCIPNSNSTLSISGGDSYFWSTGSTATNETFNTGQSGYVLVSNNCGTDSIPFTIVDGTITADFTSSASSGTAPVQVIFSNQSVNATNYNWNFGNGNSSTTTSPVYTYNEAGTYEVILTATNAFGCSDSDSTLITVLPIEEILIPNIFTPNGDVHNNSMYVNNPFIKNIKGTIYNRWGNILYQSDATDFIWNGREESGKLAPDGTYFYIFEITLINNEVREESGTVMLQR